MNKNLLLGLSLSLMNLTILPVMQRVVPVLKTGFPVRQISTTRVMRKVVCDSYIATPEHRFVEAIKNGNHHGVVEALVKHKADINFVSQDFGPAIVEAAKQNRYSLLQAMVRNHADLNLNVNAVDCKNNSALDWAIKNQHLPILTALLSCPAVKIDAAALRGICSLAAKNLTDPNWNNIFHTVGIRS